MIKQTVMKFRNLLENLFVNNYCVSYVLYMTYSYCCTAVCTVHAYLIIESSSSSNPTLLAPGMPSIVSVSTCVGGLFREVATKVEDHIVFANSAATPLSEVSVKCGIFQGDTLSPLLFCLALNPLSYLLYNLKGYKISSTMNLTIVYG